MIIITNLYINTILHNLKFSDPSRHKIRCGKRRPIMSWLMVFISRETKEVMSMMLPVRKRGLGPCTPCLSMIVLMRIGLSQ